MLPTLPSSAFLSWLFISNCFQHHCNRRLVITVVCCHLPQVIPSFYATKHNLLHNSPYNCLDDYNFQTPIENRRTFAHLRSVKLPFFLTKENIYLDTSMLYEEETDRYTHSVEQRCSHFEADESLSVVTNDISRR